MEFFKYSGSGNDFIFLDNRQGKIKLIPSKIKQWCSRREGIGADGVVLFELSQAADFGLRIFNADGSEAEMCGNATRCGVHFARQVLNLSAANRFQIEMMNGVYHGEMIEDDLIRIKMTELYDEGAINISDLGGKNNLYLNTGVPHAVVQVASVEDVNVKRLGEAIRHDVRFPAGTNVDFFEVIDPLKKTIKLRVYERGVEDETLCCGTGIMATAIACNRFFNWQGEITVFAKGGTLQAIVDKSQFFFQGRVQLVYKGFLSV